MPLFAFLFVSFFKTTWTSKILKINPRYLIPKYLCIPFIITLNPDVIIALRKMQAQDETLRDLLELAMRKLHNEDISEEIAVLEREEEREEMKILLERLKRY